MGIHISLVILVGDTQKTSKDGDTHITVTPQISAEALGTRLYRIQSTRYRQSRSPSLRSSGRNRRLWDNPLPEAKNPG